MKQSATKGDGDVKDMVDISQELKNITKANSSFGLYLHLVNVLYHEIIIG